MKKIKEKKSRKSKVTSGARYSGVPQKVFMVAASVMPSLHRPKSVIFICPSLSSIRFSNWKRQKKERVDPCQGWKGFNITPDLCGGAER